ncbi:MAG: hypothetical protein HW390_2946 [Candidatus Brocadiaceae bacterium]|nr:hypothetical protein [Candidatus Brocadiaceae bacterium]
MEEFVAHYNTKRLHSAIGYIAPQDKLLGREQEIFSERDRKLSEARERRAAKRKIVCLRYFLDKNILHLFGRQCSFSLPKSYLLPTDSADEPTRITRIFTNYCWDMKENLQKKFLQSITILQSTPHPSPYASISKFSDISAQTPALALVVITAPSSRGNEFSGRDIYPLYLQSFIYPRQFSAVHS